MLLQTERLLLREFTLADAPFIITLLNTPDWIRFIGDRNVHSVKDAENYLTNGPLKSFSENGYGLSCVVIKNTMEPIGMCGLIKRNGLENPDIGFAFLPGYPGKGYGYEIAKAVLRYADEVLKFPAVDAITNDNNQPSIGLLKKLGLSFSKEITLPGSDEVLLLFSINFSDLKTKEIDDLTGKFFKCFTNSNGAKPEFKHLEELFIPEAVIIKNVSTQPEIYSVEGFITPRIKILTDGTLTDFEEEEITGETKIFGNIAHRFSNYKKSGKMNGTSFENEGRKSIQFIRVLNEWKIASLTWDDNP